MNPGKCPHLLFYLSVGYSSQRRGEQVSLQSAFNQLVNENNWWESGESLVLGLSGGVDSVCLFHLLVHLPQKLRPHIIIAHINHHLRNESDIEENFIRELAQKYKMTVHVYHWTPDEQPVSGIELAARQIRYRFFKQVMRAEKAKYLLTAHHADDQIETILMRLVRGGALQSLTGIQLAQIFGEGQLIRPLLPFYKSELYDYAHQYQLTYFEDETNHQNEYTRNRFRNMIIPQLELENRQAKSHIQQMGKNLSDLLKVADFLSDSFKREFFDEEDKSVTIKLEKWNSIPDYMQRFMLSDLTEKLSNKWGVILKNGQRLILEEWICKGQVHTSLDLGGGIIAEKNYDDIQFCQKEIKNEDVDSTISHFLYPGQTVQLNHCEKISLYRLSEWNESEISPDSHKEVLYVSDSSIQLPLTIRHRRNGDRMSVAGMEGHKKIKDILIGEKIPQKKRNKLWIIVDETGRIIWLIGVRKAKGVFGDANRILEDKRDPLVLIYENTSI